MRMPIAVVAAATLLFSAQALAQTYQWTDADGIVHFSDEKPSGARSGVSIRPEIEVSVVKTRSSGTFRYKVDAAKGRSRATELKTDAGKCAKVKADLERVQALLRRGYGEPRGNRLRTKRRNLRDQYASHCR